MAASQINTTDAVTAGPIAIDSELVAGKHHPMHGVRDGMDEALGGKTDAAATDDTGTWSLIALVKRLLGKLPAALGQGTMAQSLRVVLASDQSALNVIAVGNVASGATDTGPPVKAAGVYNSTLPSLTTGQRGDLQVDVHSNLRALGTLTAASGVDGLSNSVAGAFQQSATGAASNVYPVVLPMRFNGSSWDRHRKANAASRIASAAASTNVTSAKGSATDVHLVEGTSARGSVCYFKVWNKATVATVGTDVPVLVKAIPPNADFFFDLKGHYLSAGYCYAFTTGPTDGDTGALAAGDITSFFTTFA
ncbi:hypothetical protein NKJ87_02390 [Mesorhizobium sp. M0027]|uniref:hypothetical protein n=1 Tax=Mesorhizobium sp. M0027 TaxID=2956848 RepID=UPI0033388437